MTRLLVSAAALAISLSTAAHAQGVPVVDTAAIANAKAEFVKEIAQMVEELEQAKALYASINGLTDMDSIVSALNSPDVRELLGPDAMQIASDFDIDLDDLGDLAGKAQDGSRLLRTGWGQYRRRRFLPERAGPHPQPVSPRHRCRGPDRVAVR